VSEPAGAQALLGAIRAVAERDEPDTRERFYAALLDSRILLPTPDDGAPAAAAAGDGRVRFFTTPPGEDGSWKILAFTDEGALSAWRPEGARHLELDARALFALAVSTPTAGILLNVAGPAGGELTRREFATLAEGAIPAAAEGPTEEVLLHEGEEVLVTAPAKPPGEAFLGVLRMALEEAGPVRAAWLADVAFGAGERHPAVGVALDPTPGDDELRGLFDGVMARIQPLLGHGRYVDFIVLDRVWAPLFEETGPPVFERTSA
jgi:type III secretion system (T3SS) SseB-like protein